MNSLSHAKSRPICAGRPGVVQGSFQALPQAGFANLRLTRTVQQKPQVMLRAGVEAFPVSLSPSSGGWPLPRDVQAKMERALGASFSDVRIHVGSEAAAIGAVAFTWGSNIHFAPGQYNPHTPQGQMLLGHELVHVVQQRAGRVRNPFGDGVAVVQDALLEGEADRLGRQAAMSHSSASGEEMVSGGVIHAPAQMGAQATSVNRKSTWPMLPQREVAAARVPQAGFSPQFKQPALPPRAAAPSSDALQRRSSAIQCQTTTVFAINHDAENINPHYDDVHITRLEPSEINNPANHAHLARAGELMHLTFRSTANDSHVVHWFYNGTTSTWREHRYNSGCPNPAAGNTSALKQRAINFSFGPSLADFVVIKPAKKNKSKGAGGAGASPSTPHLPPPPLAPASAPLPRLGAPVPQNLPWKWDEDYGLSYAPPTAVPVPAPAPALPIAPAPPIGPGGLHAAADPVFVPGIGHNPGRFGPIGPPRR